ncbi:DUF2398 family protein [Amycolatopsis sp. NPDC004378]
MSAGVSAEHDKAERARAIRALLRSPLLGREHPAFEVVDAHQDHLRRWFRTAAGWDLFVDTRRGLARLRKAPADAALPRPLLSERAEPRPFDQRRYELFCVTAAALGHFPRRQVSLQDVSRRIMTLTEDDELTSYRPEDPKERSALVDVVARLRVLGVVEVLDAQGNYERQQDSNALYAIDTDRLAVLLPGEPALPETAEETIRHALMRQLLDDPVLYLDDLGTAEQDCLRDSGRWFRQRLAEAGLLLERRAHGWCALDPAGDATDFKFPQVTAHVHQAALLVISRLALGSGPTSSWLSTHRLRHEIEQLLGDYPAWARKYRTDDGADRLAADVASLLCELDLARADGLGLELRPAAGRFRNVGIRSEDS